MDILPSAEDMCTDFLRKSLEGSVDARMVQVSDLFWALRDTTCPDGNYEGLMERGFQVRLSRRTPLTREEKNTIRHSLVSLTENGGEILGRYKYIANWIAHSIPSLMFRGSFISAVH